MPVTVDVDDLSVRDPALGAVGVGLEKRAPQTDAVCVADYRWLDNSLQQTPCLVAAYAIGVCGNGNWRVPAVTKGFMYSAPSFNTTISKTPVNVCTCSWAVYNLISGCAVCQERADGYPTWSAYILECTEQFRSDDTYYPESIIFPSGSKIPYWASYNPIKWPNGQFDPPTARALVNEAKPDLDPTADTGKKKAPSVGPIIGGVVGALVIIALAGVAAWFIIKRRQSSAKSTGTQKTDLLAGNASYYGGSTTAGHDKSHGRTFTENHSHIPGVPYNGYAGPHPISPVSSLGVPLSSVHAQQQQLSPSIGSVSYINGPNPAAVTYGSGEPVIPATDAHFFPGEGIQPYTLDPSSPSSPAFPMDRKAGFGPGGTGVVYPTLYSTPNRPPDERSMLGAESSASGSGTGVSNQPPSTAAARRMNPPAYEYDVTLLGLAGPSNAGAMNPGFANAGYDTGAGPSGVPRGEVVLESTPMRPEKSPSSTHQQFTSQGISSPSAHSRNLSGDTQDSNDTRFLATGYGSIATASAGPSGSSGRGPGIASDSSGFPQDHAPAYHHQPHFTTDGFSSAGGAHPPFSDDGATDIAGSSILGSGVADDMLEGIVDMYDGDSHYGDGPGGERWFASRSPARTVAGTVATGLSGYFLAPGSTSVGGLGRQGAEGMRPTPMPRVGGGGIRLANPDEDI